MNCQANELPSWFVTNKESFYIINSIYEVYIHMIYPYLFVRGMYGVAGGMALAIH